MDGISSTMAALAMVVQGGLASEGGLCGPPIPGEDQLRSAIVLLGETHGTKEIPASFGGLVCRSASAKPDARLLVGLEMPSSSQASIDAFLESDGGEPARQGLLKTAFWQREYQDGRSSGAMVDLLSALRSYRKAGLKIVVRGIDPEASWTAGRDAGMAAAIDQAIEEIHPTATLVLVGDVHSRMLKGYPWEPSADYVPFGAQLKTKHGDVLGLSVKAARGTAWICTSGAASECGSKRARVFEFTGATPRFALDAEAAGRTGWSGTLYLDELTASKPAAQP